MKAPMKRLIPSLNLAFGMLKTIKAIINIFNISSAGATKLNWTSTSVRNWLNCDTEIPTSGSGASSSPSKSEVIIPSLKAIIIMLNNAWIIIGIIIVLVMKKIAIITVPEPPIDTNAESTVPRPKFCDTNARPKEPNKPIGT